MRSIRCRDKDISYKVKGQGRAVVFIHGFLEDHTVWEYYTDHFWKDYTLIVPDLPGHGKSPAIGMSHTMEEQSQLIYDILQKEKVENVVLVGHSMGGYIALAFAEMFPNMIAGLCLFHSSAYADTEQKKQDRQRSIEIVKSDSRHYVNELTPKLFAPASLERISKKVEDLKEIGRRTSVEGICAALRGMSERKDRTEVLKNAKFPVQFILGKQDGVLPFETHFPLGALPACCFMALLDEVGHAGHFEAEKTSLLVLEGFFELCFTNSHTL